MKILVVEDEVSIRQGLVAMLRMEGFEVVEAENGNAGLALAREQQPELILCDVMMPELDGFGVLEQLRRGQATAAIPFIFLTARADRSDVRRGMNLGADDYLSKPFSRDELLDAINARIKRSQPLQSEAHAKTMIIAANSGERLLRDPSSAAPVAVKGYRMLQKIGTGGMSEVFLARREADGREFALKVFDTRINEDVALLHRFIEEYALLKQIDHPNVARIYEQGIADEHVFIAMEYFPGGDIKRRIADGLSLSQALGVTMHVAMALVQIHAQGIVHRDVKPDNLMLRSDGSIALIDFGIAKRMDNALEHTRHGEIIGSPYYLSPEQAAGKAVSPASDLYCLGVIFFELLTGARPYTGDHVETLLFHHLFSPPPQLDPEFAACQELLDQLMQKEAHLRIASAQAVVDYIAARWPEAATATL